MHVIKQPDSLGITCDFVQGGLELPKDSYTIPTFPNYDLGALPGSPCERCTQISRHLMRTTIFVSIPILHLGG